MPRRIEGLLQAMVNAHEHRVERSECAGGLVGAANQRGMPSRRCGGGANLARRGSGAPPSLGTVPLDDLTARQLDRRRRAGHRQPPETFAARQIALIQYKDFLRLIAQAQPAGGRLLGIDQGAAQPDAGCVHGGDRARQAHAQPALAPGTGADGQGLRCPLLELLERAPFIALEAQGRKGPRDRQDFERYLANDPQNSQRTHDQPRHVVTCDIFGDLTAEGQNLAAAVEQSHPQHMVPDRSDIGARRPRQDRPPPCRRPCRRH